MSHTQEPWKFLEQGDANEYCLVTADGLNWVIAFRINGEMMPDMQRENCRRIVACVNACAGIPIEDVEGLNGEIANAFEILRSATNQLGNAWLEDTNIRDAVNANKEESTFDEVVRVVYQRNELLAAAKQTIDENGHMADGDVCTLKVLKDAIAKVEAA